MEAKRYWEIEKTKQIIDIFSSHLKAKTIYPIHVLIRDNHASIHGYHKYTHPQWCTQALPQS